MRTLTLYTFLLIGFYSYAQKDASAIISDNLAYRQELNTEFSDPEHSPLPPEEIPEFDSLPFFPIDTGFYIIARFERIEDGREFEMPTTTERKPRYRLFGKAHFTLNGKTFTLEVYQNLRLQKTPGYEDYLFIPFTDHTNGNESYGGGRYLDVRIPSGDTLILDFNKAYNPYCAYDDRFSCPIPPKENMLDTPITAGVKYEKDH